MNLRDLVSKNKAEWLDSMLTEEKHAEGVMPKVPKPEPIPYSKEADAKITASQRNEVIAKFESGMHDRIIGQPKVIDAFVHAYKTHLLGMNPPNRPITVMLLAGPTGVGKTLSCQAAAETLYGNRNGFTRVDCAEIQHGHEVAKLTGAPPGYLGHRETEAIFSPARIEKWQTTDAPFNLVLFDEIEKGHPALWDLMLGIFDTGTMTCGNNLPTDFTKSIIIMTTNLGAKEMDRILKGTSLGFVQPDFGKAAATTDSVIRGTFRPEFINRIDTIVALDKLSDNDMKHVLKLEMVAVQERILHAKCPVFILKYTHAAETQLLSEGTDDRYGARALKRTIERLVVQPLIDMLLRKEIDSADIVTVDAENGKIIFRHIPRGAECE